MNREEFDIDEVKPEDARALFPDYPDEAIEAEEFSDGDGEQQPRVRRIADEDIFANAEQHLDLAPIDDVDTLGFYDSLRLYLELIGKKVSVEGVEVFKAGGDPCSAFLALHRLFSS